MRRKIAYKPARGFDPSRDVGRLQIQHEPHLRRGQLSDRAEEIRETTFIGGDECAHELSGFIRTLPDERLPYRLCAGSAGHTHAGRRHAQDRCGDEKCRRVPRRDLRDQIGLAGEPCACAIVERQQSVIEQRRTARLQYLGDQGLRRRAAAEHDIDPDAGRQRERDRLG